MKCKRMKPLRSSFAYLFLISAIVIYSVFFTHLSILKYLSFFSCAADDLAIHNNILWHTSFGRPLYQSIGERLLDFHPSFFYVFLLPFYALFKHVFTLFFLGHSALALGAIPVFWLSRERCNSQSVALLFALAYLVWNPIHNISFADHNVLVPFSISFLLFAFYFFIKQNRIKFLFSALLAMLCRDETAFIIVMFSAYALIKKMPLRCKIIPCALGLGYLFCVWLIIMPALGYPKYNNPYVWNLFGKNPQIHSFAGLFLYRIVQITNKLFSFSHISLLARLFDTPIFYLSFLAPEILLMGFPVFVAVQLSVEAYFLSIESVHHLAYLMIFIFLAAMAGVQRFLEYFYKKGLFPRSFSLQALRFGAGALLLLCALLTNVGHTFVLPPGGPLRGYSIYDRRFIASQNIYDPVFYTQEERDRLAWEFIRMVPTGASVATTQAYLSALSSRTKIYHFGCLPDINERDGHDFEADYVFINKDDDYIGYGGQEVSQERKTKRLTELLSSPDHTIVKETKEFILLKRKVNQSHQ